MTTSARKVLLYGTSANPPVGMTGHMGAVAYCRQFVDEVWLLPVYQHIYSSKRELAPFDMRVRMCELARKALPAEGAPVKVEQYERELFEHLAAQTQQSPEALRIGSIDLVEYLRARFPDTAFTMLLGADTYIDLCAGKWKRGDELRQLVSFLVMDRKGVDAPWRQHSDVAVNAVDTVDADAERVRFITIPALSDVSSTQVRATRDVAKLRELVGPDVAAFIIEHKLYAFADNYCALDLHEMHLCTPIQSVGASWRFAYLHFHFRLARAGAAGATTSMKYPLLRRFRLAELDREVARASMQICHKIVMQQLYISRADVRRQWVVISNPSEETIDLTGYAVASTDGNSMFRFPRKYTLLAGDQVTIWCSPGGVDLDTDNVLEPYLFWTEAGGSLRNAPFFTPDTTNEVLLLDPMMTEVASLKIYDDGRKAFRVLNCTSQHARSSATGSLPFCVGCLSPPQHKATDSGCNAATDSVYVFSRYWDVVSDKSLVTHFVALVLAPLVECVRALLIYVLLTLFQQRATNAFVPSDQLHQFPAPPHRVIAGPQLQTKVVRLAVLMTACDVLTRRLALGIKSGLLVTVLSGAAVVLDQFARVALYTALERLYPPLAPAFHRLLCLELGLAALNVAALQLGFLDSRDAWHPAFQELARWDYTSRYTVALCGAGKELLTHVLLLLPLQTQQPSGIATVLAYALVPLFTVAMGMDVVRGVATLLHLLQYPWRHRYRRGLRLKHQ